jgi:hypothetical protein
LALPSEKEKQQIWKKKKKREKKKKGKRWRTGLELVEEYLLQDETQAVHLRRVVRDRAAIFVFAQVRHHLLQQRRQIRPIYTHTHTHRRTRTTHVRQLSLLWPACTR